MSDVSLCSVIQTLRRALGKDPHSGRPYELFDVTPEERERLFERALQECYDLQHSLNSHVEFLDEYGGFRQIRGLRGYLKQTYNDDL